MVPSCSAVLCRGEHACRCIERDQPVGRRQVCEQVTAAVRHDAGAEEVLEQWRCTQDILAHPAVMALCDVVIGSQVTGL